MADRCAGCGGWLQPGVDVCPTCQRPAEVAGATESPFDAPLDLGLAQPSSPEPTVPPIEPLEEAPPPPKAASAKRQGPRPIDDAEIRRLARYPERPLNPLAAIPYAVSVFQRRAELSREREHVALRSRQAGERADERFSALGSSVMQSRVLLDLGAVASQLTAVETAQAEADERGEEYQRAQTDAATEAEALDAQIVTAEEELGPSRDRETRLGKELEMANHELARAKARAQRAEIQLRNAGERSESASLEGSSAEHDARDAEFRLAEEKTASLSEELALVRRDMASRLAALTSLKKSRASLQRGLDSSAGIHRENAGAASDALTAALRDLGREVSARDLVSELGEAAELASRATGERDARLRELDLHNRALDAYDKKGFQTGGAIIGAAGLFILVALVTMVLR